MEPGDEITVGVSFVCPFCQVPAHTVKPEGVMHEMPACFVFLSLDPVEYLRAVNGAKRREN